MKKIAFFILVALLPVLASAYDAEIDGIYYNLSGDEAEVTYYDYWIPYSFTELTIPSSVTYDGKTYRVTRIANSAFRESPSLTNITISVGVTSIGEFAFYNCPNLTTVVLPESLTTIEGYAFRKCSKLTNINFPSGLVGVGTLAFEGTGWYNNQPDGLIYLGKTAYAYKGSMPANTSITIKEGTEILSGYVFASCNTLTSVTIPNSVTTIGPYAFLVCNGLTSVTLSNSLKSLDLGVFNGCRKLPSLTIPESVTSIGDNTFCDCEKLTSITIPENVTSIGKEAFKNCKALTDINLAGDNLMTIGESAFEGSAWYNSQPNGVIYLGTLAYCYKGSMTGGATVTIKEGTTRILSGLFKSSYNLAAVILPESLKNIGESAFESCINLVSINIPNSVTSIGESAFENCTSLSSITLSNSLTSIEPHAFEYCEKLTSATIPEGVTSIGERAFHGCRELTSLTIPESVTDIGKNAFYGCESLASVSLSGGLTQIEEGVFYGCTGLTSATIPNGVTLIDKNAFNGCSGLTSIIIPDGVTRLNSSAFFNCTGLTSVTIPGSVSVILDKVFMNCKSLTAINLPEGVRSISSEAFRDCSSLTSITIPSTVTDRGSNIFSGCYVAESAFVNNSNYPDNSWGVNFIDQEINGLLIKNNIVLKCRDWVTSANIPEGITGIGRHAFDNCPNLTSVTFPASVKTIDSSAFYECKGLTSVTFQEGLTSIGDNAFQFCKGLTSITIPGSVTTIGKYAFANCSGLTSVTLLEGSTVIDKYAFQNCSSLTSVNLQEGLTVIGNYAFQDCSSLTSITIPNSVTSIGEYAFRDCKGLTSITIPNSVTTIGTEAFNGCTSLTTVTIGNGVTKIGNGAFYGCNKIATLSIDMESVGTTFANSTMLSTLTFGNNVRTIKGEAFKGCSMLTTVNIGDGVRSINNTSFQGINNNAKFYVKDKTLSLLALWNAGYDSNIYDADTQAKIEPFKPVFDVTASSLKFVEGLTGIRRITKLSEKLYLNDAEGTAFTGLDPDTEVNVKYSVILKYLNEDETFTFERTSSVKTAELVLTTKQPKVISDGNVIVAAQSNLDDEETNVGFEWRRTDWTDDFDSKTGGAYLYEGAMEGYIRSLNSKYLWKFRPYYTSNAGNTYYGDWKGLDPSDYSYFEPTVHTYANINVQGNTAEVRGYAMRGTDNIVTQGFIYWQNRSSYSLRKKAASIPSDAITVTTAKTNIMTATLEDLEFETEYCCVAFVTTSEDETFYGEVQTFSTSFDPDGIQEIKDDELRMKNEGEWYDLSGRKILNGQSSMVNGKLPRGINIIRYSDGTSKKVLIK